MRVPIPMWNDVEPLSLDEQHRGVVRKLENRHQRPSAFCPLCVVSWRRSTPSETACDP